MPKTVDFYLDPGCPWTWLTSRWLVDVADDTATASELDEALALAGPDIGSPVLRIDDASRGFHGPIVGPGVTGEAALRLFDAITVLQAEPALFEIKRERATPPALGAVR